MRELSYTELQTRDDSIEGYAYRRYWKGHYLPELSFLMARSGAVEHVKLAPFGPKNDQAADQLIAAYSSMRLLGNILYE